MGGLGPVLVKILNNVKCIVWNIHHVQHRRQERDIDRVCESQSIVCRRDRIAHQHLAMRRLVRLTIDIHGQERRFGEIGSRGDRLALEQLDEFFVLPAPGRIVVRSWLPSAPQISIG